MNQPTLKNHLLFLFILLSSFIQAQDYVITNFETNIEITKEGHLKIEEIIDVNFNKKRRGIIRSFENKYAVNNRIAKFDIQDIDVPNHNSKLLNKKNETSIRIGNPDKYLKGPERYLINYTVKNGILPFPNHQELHYDITGHKWDTSIENLSFTITLPKGITLDANDLKITGGRENQNLNLATIQQINPSTIKGKAIKRLPKYNGLTTAIKFPSRYLAVANNEVEFFESVENNANPKVYKPWYIVLPLGLFGLFLTFWRRLRKNEFEEDSTLESHYPPQGLTSAHIGAFEDQSSNTRDIVSLLPYWASEGYLEMKQVEDDIFLYRIKNLPSEFPEYEHIIFDKLFQEKDVSMISDLSTKFYSTLYKAQKMLSKEIKNQEYYRTEYLNYFRSWKLISFPLVMLGIGLISLIHYKLLFLGIASIVVCIVSLILPLFKIPLSEKGTKLKYEINAFKRFIKDPEPNQLENLIQKDPQYFDKIFPFVVAFGFEKKFLDTLQPYMSNAPHWYLNDQTNNSFSSFSSGFKPETIQSAFSSNPHSSSPSSGGGSFSSGSGMGGGGGSSW